jgi:hypothetical protein
MDARQACGQRLEVKIRKRPVAAGDIEEAV